MGDASPLKLALHGVHPKKPSKTLTMEGPFQKPLEARFAWGSSEETYENLNHGWTFSGFLVIRRTFQKPLPWVGLFFNHPARCLRKQLPREAVATTTAFLVLEIQGGA